MSRNLKDQKRHYEARRLPEPRQPDYPGPRTDPACYSSRTFRTDPAWYNSRTTNRDSWRGQLSFESSLPYEHNDQLEPIHNYLLDPDSFRPTTPPDDGNTERSVRNTRHFRRSEERASERHAPRAYESRETRRSEGRSSGNSGKGVKKPTQTPKPYSREDDQAIINYVKEGKNWQQIALKLDHTKQSVKQHWNRRLKFDDRAKGIEYAFTHS